MANIFIRLLSIPHLQFMGISFFLELFPKKGKEYTKNNELIPAIIIFNFFLNFTGYLTLCV